MEQTKLKVGGVVRLKSGGPKMTIKEIDTESIKCIYFNEFTQIFGSLKCEAILLDKVE